jgi:hypothetical protein
MSKGIFIDPAWIGFDEAGASHIHLDQQVFTRSYRMWRHAESKITPDAHDLDLADSILWLNRTVNFRTKSLSKDHALRSISASLEIDKKRSSEIMAEIGLIRPRMLRELIVLRNAVEHEDAAPPSLERCQEFSEFVWYFLRSTDDIARLKLTSLDLISTSRTDDWVVIDFEVDNAKLSLRGKLGIEQVSWTRRDEWTYVELTEKPRIKANAVLFNGIITGPRMCLIRIWRRYFQLDDH